MAQQQHAADVHPDELCPLNKRYYLMDANKKVDLEHFWHTVKEDGSKYRLKFMLDKKELTLILDDFRTIFHLPQATDNNHNSFVPPPSFSDMVPFYKQILRFTMELKTSSSFKTTGLLQPWQTVRGYNPSWALALDESLVRLSRAGRGIKVEKKVGSRTHRLRRLYKVGRSARVVSSEDEGLGDQEDASKQGRKIDEIDQDAEVTLVDETQGRYGDNLMFDTGVLDNEQDMAEKEVDMAEKDVSTADPVTTAGEVVTTANVVVSTAEVTTDSTTTTTVDELTLAQTLIEIKAAKPKARGVIVQEPSEFTTTTSPLQPSQLPQAKDKGKAKMVKPEKPLKKDQIMLDKEVAQKLQAQLDAKLEEEEKFARQREEDAEEQRELTIEEKSRFFVELVNKRKKHFARLRAEDSKRAGDELEQEKAKKQKIDDDQEEAEMRNLIKIVPDEEDVVIDAIPLATKPLISVDWLENHQAKER
ncbi:hypothetical protein Tco_1105430 [Tanacetum coccineum]